MSTYDDSLLATRFAALAPEPLAGDWDEVLGRSGGIARTDRLRPRGLQGRRRRLVVLAAAVLVVVVGAASAFGTVRDIFGNGKPHVARGFYPSEGKRGSFTVRLVHMDDRAGNGTSEWRIVPEPTQNTPSPTGQYVHVSGRGRILRIGGHAEAWHAGLLGFVSRPGEAKQRVVITMKGRPKGVFVLTPLQPGFLKRDSGTREYHWATG